MNARDDERATDVDVTVVVPCYNVEHFLDQALLGVLANDRCALEVLVLNDGSTDGSLAVMEAHARRDARVRVIDKDNQGYGATVNRGLDEARGTYVAVLEPDDYIMAHAYDELFSVAEQAGLPDVVKSAYWRVVGAGTDDEHLRPCHFHDAVYPPRRPFTIVEEPAFLRHHPSIWSALYRRAFLDGCHIRMREVPGAGWVDNPFLVETLVQASSIVYVNDMYYCYREDLAGSSSDITVSTVPFERWHEQIDVLERLGVTDDGVWDCVYTRAFEPIAHAVAHGGLDDERCHGALEGVCDRMDEARVHALPMALPEHKALYYELEGLDVPSDLGGVFLRGRARDFARTLVHYGPAAFARRVRGVVERGGRHA